MPFTDYAGTDFVPYLLPIIPADATLNPRSKLKPENLGKIPGWRTNDGWSGFNWSKILVTESQLAAYEKMYDGGAQTIAIQAKRFPGLDIDLSLRPLVEAIRQIAYEEMGETISRGRANSARVLMMYRAAPGEQLMRKMRHVYQPPDGGKPQAIEWLANGQQYLIEGNHPSGVPYEWEMWSPPLSFGADKLPVVEPSMVEAFFARADQAMAFAGWTRVKGGDTMRMSSTLGVEPHDVGPDHPELCPDLDMLKDVLENYLPSDHHEFAEYDDWATAWVSIVTACGKNEEFYDEVLLPWAMADPRATEEDYIRQKWDSVRSSSIGWSYIAGIAHSEGYTGDVEHMMPALPDDPNNPQPEVPSARLDASYEAVVADQFIKEHALMRWVFVPGKVGGVWRKFGDGIWEEDASALHDASLLCQKVGAAIRASGNMTTQQPQQARAMYGARTAEAALRLVRANPAIIRKRSLFDANSLILGVPGGFIDEEGRLRDPDPGLLLTRKLGVRPDFSARCPKFEHRVMMLANRDPEVADFMWTLLGYTLTGKGSEQVYAFLHGNKGGEGKTTFNTVIGMAMGKYGASIPAETFMRKNSDQRFSQSQLDGAFFAYVNEVERGQEWHEARLKLITGSGVIPIEKKFVDAYDIWIRATLWFSGNFLPRFREGDPALQRRTIIFECMNPIPKDEDIPGWATMIFAQEGPAILARLIERRQAYLRRGKLLIPSQITKWNEDYFAEQDSVGQFIDALCEKAPGTITLKQAIYDAYRGYAAGTMGAKNVLGRTNFYTRFAAHPKFKAYEVDWDCARVRVAGQGANPQSVVQGIRLLSPFETLAAEG